MGRMPWHLLLGALALTGIGVAFVWSAGSARMAARHAVFAAIGLLAFTTVALFDYRHLTLLAGPLYVAGLLSLALLFAMGVRLNAALRWYDLGPVHLQPSEPMKYLVVIALAEHFRLRRRRERLRDLLAPLAITGLPMVLIMLQPDLGTAMVILPLFFAMAFLAGVPTRNLVIVTCAGLALAAGVWFTPGVLRPYQRARVDAFLGRADEQDSAAAYNAQQAMAAISAGRIKGRGWGRGELTRLERIPEQYADFIFPVIAEEWGFRGAAALVVAVLVMVAAMSRVAVQMGDRFGRLLVGGVVTLFAVQSGLHVAISLRLAPITGLTLRFVSYGGSSLGSTFAGLGLLASARLHRGDAFADGEELT